VSRLASVEEELRARPRAWLVTGAAGFIGTHLGARLLALGQRVVGLDDLSTGRRENLAWLARQAGAERFAFVEADACDERAVRAAAEGVAVVLHQAGLGSVPRSLREPARTLRANVLGTASVLAAARAHGVRRVVMASSSSVYGDHLESPQVEERIGRALSPYAASKQVAELLAAGCARAGGPECVALRYFNVFGPRQDPRGPYAAVIARWSAALAAGGPLVLEGDGLQARDLTPVAAVVAANLLSAEVALPEPFVALNVGTGRSTTLRALLDALQSARAALGAAGAPPELRAAPARSGERRESRAELTRARTLLGYEPPAELGPALREVLRAAIDARGGAL
jgi:UDP-N-acetylglucosamine 4-epimerase